MDKQYRQFLSDILNDNYPDIWTDENHVAIVAYAVEQLGLAADFETPYAQWTTFIPIVANGISPIVSPEATVASGGVALQSTSRVRYDRSAAVRYAYEYTNRYGGWNRNWAYLDFSNSGGDCTNFVSQAVLAGGISMRGDGTCRSESTTHEWYIYRLRTECGWWWQSFRLWKWSTSWTTVGDFRAYRRDYGASRVEAYPANKEALSLLISRARPGDIIQFDVYDRSKGWVPTHSIIVVKSANNDLLYNDHSGSILGSDTFEGSIRGKLREWSSEWFNVAPFR
ncbi:amidase domain-containing protein [Chloroflexus sp.]|uniref:amidase domain-containing protein n=1 Tax=Chloroflexus sp. TaxID=1904827 RepID=UPI002ACEF196|nr:amidase domain-containing protein [Chloroflexus sp.]